MPNQAQALRVFIEAFNRHDFDDAVRYLHPEVEIYPAIGGQLDVGRRYFGRDQSRQLLETISEGVTNNVEIEDVFDAGEFQVLQVEHGHPRGRQGVENHFEISTIYTFRDGLVIRLEGFRDRDQAFEAFEAAGLRE